MTDKVQKIKDWISREQDGLIDAQGNFGYSEHGGAYHILCNLDAYIDSLQEEPVSEDLEEAALMHFKDVMEYEIKTGHKIAHMTSFKAGAEWQKQKDRKWLADNHKQIFNNGWSEGYEVGRDSMEEDMMKDAYKGYVSYIRGDSEAVVYLKDSCITMPSYFPKSNLKDGDNVRILVIKDE